jgi:hypothetical protein
MCVCLTLIPGSTGLREREGGGREYFLDDERVINSFPRWHDNGVSRSIKDVSPAKNPPNNMFPPAKNTIGPQNRQWIPKDRRCVDQDASMLDRELRFIDTVS